MGKRKIKKFAAGLILACLALVPKQVSAGYTWGGDPQPYCDYDYSNVYAKPYIEGMRQSKVVSGWYSYDKYYFRPTLQNNSPVGPKATRAWYGMVLSERLTDLADCTVRIPNTDWYWDNRRWFVPYANAMATNGLIGTGTFTDGTILRQEAFAWVVRMAGLEPVALAMSDSEVSYWLGIMTDGNSVSSEYRRDIALAIKLGICRGDEQDRIKPLDELWREHAAIIAYRAIAINYWADPAVFRPQDGEVTTIRSDNIGNGTVVSWTLTIQNDAMSNTIKQWSGTSLPSVITVWDGKDSSGKAVTAGWYWLKLDVQYTPPEGSTISLQLPPKRVRIDGRDLTAWVSTNATAGTGFHLVEAKVVGIPDICQVDTSWGLSVPMTYDANRGVYVAPVEVPPTLQGVQHISVFASIRDVDLPPKSFRVEKDVVLNSSGALQDAQVEELSSSGSSSKQELPMKIRLERQKGEEGF